MLDAKTVQQAILNDVSGGSAYFTSFFTDGQQAVYAVSLPEPAGAVTFVTFLTLCGARWSRSS